MAPAGWATQEQRDFFEARVSDFQQAQRSNKTQVFWNTVHKDFFERWPDPSAEAVSTVQKRPRQKKGTLLLQEAKAVEELSLSDWTEQRKKVFTMATSFECVALMYNLSSKSSTGSIITRV